jgi:peptide deformylase
MLEIVVLPEPNLRKPSETVTKEFLLLPETQEFINAMIPAMYKAKGVGLAASQVAKNIRICIVGKEADESLKDDLILINPVWTKNNRKVNTDHEGCLSVPKKFGKVKRYADIHVEALDRHGNPLSFDAKNFFARVVQHEADHLNGSLFIDKATDIYEAE